MHKHSGYCTIYASMSNGDPTDGICTCGYGLYKKYSSDYSELFSKEREEYNKNYYGGNKTIHDTEYLDVETNKGKVVSIWFRCLHLNFKQIEVDSSRAKEMKRLYSNGKNVPKIDAIVVKNLKG